MRGEGEGCGALANEYSCAVCTSRDMEPQIIWRSTSIFKLLVEPTIRTGNNPPDTNKVPDPDLEKNNGQIFVHNIQIRRSEALKPCYFISRLPLFFYIIS